MNELIPIDKVYYINLDSRVDRKEHFESNVIPYFQETGLESCIERFPAIKHEQGLLGCSMSHLEVIKKAKENNARFCMIFEDDFEFIVSKEVFLKSLEKLFEGYTESCHLDFKVIMLAYNSNQRSNFNQLLDSTTDSQTCSGYIVNSKYYDEIISCWEEGVQKYQETGRDWIYCCDQYWKQLQKEKWFLFKTRIGKQMAGYSDCGKRFIDYTC